MKNNRRLNRGEETTLGLVVHLDLYVAAFACADASAFLGIEMVLAGFPAQKLAIFGGFEALGE